MHNLLGCDVLLFQNRSIAIGAISKHLEVIQHEIVKLMVQLKPSNQLGSKSRAQNVLQKLGQGRTPSPPPLGARLLSTI